MRLPRVTGSEALRALHAAGFAEVRVTGSHHLLHHPMRPGVVAVPVHAGALLKPKTLRSILRQAALTHGGLHHGERRHRKQEPPAGDP